MTRYDHAALERLIDGVAPYWKGAPLGRAVTLRELGASGADALSLPLPLLLLKEPALAHNIARMAAYAEAQDALLAPHVKTTMSPEIARRQLDAGAWAVTVANPAQAAALSDVGARRVVVANEVVDAAGIAVLSTIPDDVEVLVWVDSVDAVTRLDAATGRRLDVLALIPTAVVMDTPRPRPKR